MRKNECRLCGTKISNPKGYNPICLDCQDIIGAGKCATAVRRGKMKVMQNENDV